MEPGGAAVINADTAQFARLKAAAHAAGVERIVSFGERDGADARLAEGLAAGRDLDRAGAASSATTSPTSSARPGGTWCDNSLGVLAAA